MKNRTGSASALVATFLSFALAACNEPEPEAQAEPESLLYVWLYDADKEDPDFIAVIDADPQSPGYGEVRGTVLAGEVRGGSHHTSITLPYSGFLFANDFLGNYTYIFDTSEPSAPKLVGEFGNIGRYSFPHSFSELPTGNILVTFQSKDGGNEVPGGMVELTTMGKLVQAGDADPGDPEIFLRPYGIVLLPAQDRLVVTTFDMRGAGEPKHIQIWRLSDLELLHTLPVPGAEGKTLEVNPFEGRVLADGETVMFETLSCGLYVLKGAATEAPEITLVHDFEGEYCGLPVRLGNYWVQTVETETPGDFNALIVLDISDPLEPVEVDRLVFEDGFGPHWSTPNATGRRIAISGYGDKLSRRVVLVDFDPASGKVTLDEAFGAGDSFGPGLMIDRESWPHGATGPAIAHGAVFWPPAAPDWKN